MKNVLYIDKPFLNEIGGDKNRSRYLYNGLIKFSNLFLCVIDCENNFHKNDIKINSSKSNKFLLPMSILYFEKNEMKKLFDYIKSKNIKTLFIRTIAYTQIAIETKKMFPDIEIVIDADLILSRLMEQSWKKKPSVKNRFYFIQMLKLKNYESKLYKQNFTILLSSEFETELLSKQYPNCKFIYLQNSTDLTPKKPNTGENKEILFYGAMDSTANIDGYKFIQNKLFSKILPILEEYNYTIKIVGKGCEKLTPSSNKRLQIVGKVDSIEKTILKSDIVLLPIFIASGTNTRVIETAMAGRALITTSLGMEGLADFQTYETTQEIYERLLKLITSSQEKIESATILQEKIFDKFNIETFENKLNTILNQG